LFTGWRVIPRIWAVASPSIRLPEPSVLDLGRGKPGEVISGTFALENTGGGDLDYQIEASCGCSSLTPQAGRIAPGRSQEVRVGVRLGTEGEKRSVKLVVRSNDPTRPTGAIEVTTECPAPAIATPNRVDFGRLASGTSGEQTVTVEIREEVVGEDLAAIVPKLSSGLFLASMVRVDQSPPRLVVKVSYPPSLPLGVSVDTLTLSRSGGVRLVEIPIVAEVIRPLVIVPEIVFLRASTASSDHSRPLILVKRLDGKLVGPLAKLEAPGNVKVEEVSDQKRNYRQFRLVFSEVPTLPIQIKLRFEGEPEALGVRIVPLGRQF
jgi:hypothetical protein